MRYVVEYNDTAHIRATCWNMCFVVENNDTAHTDHMLEYVFRGGI